MLRRIDQVVSLSYQSLILGAEQAICDSLNWTLSRAQANGTVPQEPDFVAGLVIAGTQGLQLSWGPILRRAGIALRVAGVFTHQSPKVGFPQISPRSCELADLVFVHFHMGPDGRRQEAILWQAKMNPGMAPHTLGKNDQDQLRLYSQWPSFEYTTPPGMAGQRRSVTPPRPHPGAQYLLIDPQPRQPIQDRVTSAMASPTLVPGRFAGAELVEMLRSNGGRDFTDNPATAQDYSQVIWDLLHASWNRGWTFNRGRVNAHRVPRGWWGRQLSGLAVGCLDRVLSTIRVDKEGIRNLDWDFDLREPPPTDPTWPGDGGPSSAICVVTYQSVREAIRL